MSANRKSPQQAEQNSPPAAARYLLRLFLRRDEREFILGDLEEEYRTDVLPRLGPRAARRWYWSQVLRSLRPAQVLPPRKHRTRPEKGDAFMQTLWQDLR